MLHKLSTLTHRPRKAPTRKALLLFLAVQAVMLLLSIIVIVAWPYAATAIAPIVFMCFGYTVMLWLEVYENRLGQPAVNE